MKRRVGGAGQALGYALVIGTLGGIPSVARAQEQAPPIHIQAVVVDTDGSDRPDGAGLLGLSGSPVADRALTRELQTCLSGSMVSRPVGYLVPYLNGLLSVVTEGGYGIYMKVTAVEGDPPVGLVEVRVANGPAAELGATQWVLGEVVSGKEAANPDHDPRVRPLPPMEVLCNAALAILDRALQAGGL